MIKNIIWPYSDREILSIFFPTLCGTCVSYKNSQLSRLSSSKYLEFLSSYNEDFFFFTYIYLSAWLSAVFTREPCVVSLLIPEPGAWGWKDASWKLAWAVRPCQHLRDRGRRSLCVQGQPGLHRETLSQQNKITTKKSVPNKIEWEWGLLSRILKTLHPVPSTGEWTNEWMNEWMKWDIWINNNYLIMFSFPFHDLKGFFLKKKLIKRPSLTAVPSQLKVTQSFC